MKLTPLADNVVLKRFEAEEKTASGIILSTANKEKSALCEVVAVGPGKKDEPMTVKVTRTILLLPEEAMRPRLADSRIGIFLTDMSRINGKKDKIEDFSVINRWNIQPKDMEAWKRGELVEPAKPIVFYLDDAFPALWREPIRRGVLRWNKAFEKIGFKNVMHIEDFPKDDPEFDPDNLKYSCIRYVPAAVANAMGPSWVDPRSGEIINASVLMYNDVVKLAANWRFVQTAQVDERVRGKELPDDVFQESLEYILAHEVGHCLGLMHNMAASSAFPVDSLRSASFTQQHGTTPSIMDYARFNYVAQPGDKGVKLTPPDLGPYDDYVIKYAYTPLPDKKDMFDEEKTIRGWIDEKVGDPIYRYGRQQVIARYDPTAIEEDLGDDHIKAGDYGIGNLKYVLSHMEEWITDEEDPDLKIRTELYEAAAGQFARYVNAVMLNVGGIYLTDVNSNTAGGPQAVSVPKELQRASLKWVLAQMKDSAWLEQPALTEKLPLHVDLSFILRFNFCRTFFTSLSWSDEVTRYLLIWSTFLGATCVYRHSGNIAITFIQDLVPKKLGAVMRIAVHAICCFLFAVLLVFSVKYCGKLVKTATALPIKMKYIYLCIPISMGILMLHALVMALGEVETMKEVKG